MLASSALQYLQQVQVEYVEEPYRNHHKDDALDSWNTPSLNFNDAPEHAHQALAEVVHAVICNDDDWRDKVWGASVQLQAVATLAITG